MSIISVLENLKLQYREVLSKEFRSEVGPFVTSPYSCELNILSKKVGPDLGFYTPLVFPVILCYKFQFFGDSFEEN